MTSETPSPAAPPDAVARKPLQTFALHAAFLTVLLAVIPSADSLYPLLFSRLADAAAAPFAGEHAVDFEWVRIGARRDRGEVVMRGSEGGAAARRPLWETAFSMSERGYRPAALFIALMVATPMRMRRRVPGIVAGVALHQAFLLGQLGVLALASFQDLRPEEFGTWLLPLRPILEGFFQSLLPRYVVVVALWAVLGRPDRGVDWSFAVGLVGKLIR